jgi:hypothetical protein
MHESIDESPNFTNICIFRGENAYLWRNINVICSVHTFFHIFSKLLPQLLKFRGWDRFDGIRRIHSMLFTGRKCVTLEKFQCDLQRPYIFSRFFET